VIKRGKGERSVEKIAVRASPGMTGLMGAPKKEVDGAMSRYQDWLRKAENDILWARHSLDGGFFAQTCFISQQAGEKALKALCFLLGYDVVRTHSLYQLVRSLGIDGRLEEMAKELDLYYISGRCPDAFPAGAPFELFTADQAGRALKAGEAIVAMVRERVEESRE